MWVREGEGGLLVRRVGAWARGGVAQNSANSPTPSLGREVYEATLVSSKRDVEKLWGVQSYRRPRTGGRHACPLWMVRRVCRGGGRG